MARPQKIGLDYFPLDVNFYGDIKIRKLMRNNGGGKAAFVYVTLLCKIYESGYYMVWDDDMSFMLSDITGFEEGMIRECIKSCLQFGLLDKELFDSHAILTSKGIQLRYLSATRRRVETVSKLPFIYPELLDEFLRAKTDNETEFMSTETPLMSTESIESKVKESKVKHSSSVLQRAGAHTHTHTREGEGGVVDLWEQNDRQLFADVDKEIELLHNSSIWKEQVLMRYKFLQQNETILDELIDRWGSEMKISSKKHQTLNDLRTHFNYCLQKLETDSIKNAKANGSDVNNGYRSREDIFNSAVRIMGELQSESKKTLSDIPVV